METTNCNLQEFTKLPLRVVNVGDQSLPDVLVMTPEGEKIIKLKQEYYPFIFGSVTQIDVHLGEVLSQIKNLENRATEFLFKQWKQTLK